MSAGGGMVSNDVAERNLSRLASRFPAYNVDGLREVLQANGSDVSAAIRMLDGEKGPDIVETGGIIDPCSTDIDGKLAGLAARFPTYEVGLLKEILQSCGGNVDEAIAEIELPSPDEFETLCEDEVQGHDEEGDQIDDETVNAEESAAIIGDKEVDDSDQEDEDDSEYTDAGALALPDIKYTDSFERDFYSSFGISSNEVIESQTRFKSRLTAILTHIVHGIAECSFEDLEKRERWFTAGFWNVLHLYTDEHITMLVDSIESAVLPEVRTVFGMNAPRRELFLELRAVTRSHSHKGIYMDYVVNDNNRERDGIYIGSASGKKGLVARVDSHKSTINGRKEKSCHYNFIHENNATFNFRVLAVFSQGVNAGQDPATVPSWLVVLLEAVMIIMAGSYRYSGISTGYDSPEVAGLVQVLSIHGFGSMRPREQLNRALPIRQGWKSKQARSCTNCKTVTAKKFRRAQGALPGTLYLCQSCWTYKQVHKKDKPESLFNRPKTRIEHKNAGDRVCDNPNCQITESEGFSNKAAKSSNYNWKPHPSKDGRWLCVSCHRYLKKNNEDRPKKLVEQGRLANRKVTPRCCSICHATELPSWLNKPGEPGTIVCTKCYSKLWAQTAKKKKEEKAEKEGKQKRIMPKDIKHKVCYLCKTEADGTNWKNLNINGSLELVCRRCYTSYTYKHKDFQRQVVQNPVPKGSRKCSRCGREGHTKHWQFSKKNGEVVCRSCAIREQREVECGKVIKARPAESLDKAKIKISRTCYHCKRDLKQRRWEKDLREWLCSSCYQTCHVSTDELPITREQVQDKECRCEKCKTLYSSTWKLVETGGNTELWCGNCYNRKYTLQIPPDRTQYQPEQGSPDVTFQAFRWRGKVTDGSKPCRSYFRRVHGIDNSIEALVAMKTNAETGSS
jgi:hypothetical protein